MTDKVTIYIVTNGSYSDKDNQAVFSTREQAEKLKDYLNSDTKYPDADIEEFELDLTFEEWQAENAYPPVPTRKRWHIVFKKDTADIIYISEVDSGIEYSGFFSDGGFFTEINTETQEQAAKIAMERRSVWLANRIVEEKS